MNDTENENIIKELNSFLKGINMGSDAFTTYLEKTNNPSLQQEFKKIISIFASQKEKVVAYIEKLNGEPNDSLGIIGEMASAFEKIKDIFMDKDEEILQSAIKAVDMGIQGGSKAVSNLQNLNANPSMIKTLNEMLQDYDTTSNALNLLSKKIK